ncbi:MAG: bifunctional transaldolase/phosoglucose isomerase [Deltaproteobacteria bacterium]|nr:bifunctional transaldolase/phosoglucose isomerase [Deltaproteobacteria bacterium]
MANQIFDLRQYGQSVWYDFISRQLLASGELLRIINRDGVSGVTSNPSILEQAINKTDAYDEEMAILARHGLSAEDIYTRVAVQDITEAADILQTVSVATNGGDGYVSLEVSPRLADDAEGTIAEAHRLWQQIRRDNVMIKVPGTPAGFRAVRKLISDGINVNITLLFSIADYEAAAQAYIGGLSDRLNKGGDISRVASVASVFVSRIDSLVDKLLDQALATTRDSEARQGIENLKGKAAIANSKLVYQRFKALFSSSEWQRLEEHGARRQRPLWASTGTKNPKYSDVLYIEELVGPDTVNTVPPGALAAFRDHGRARPTIELNTQEAQNAFDRLGELGVDMTKVHGQLKEEGLQAFADSFDTLLLGVDTKRKAALLKGRYQIAGAKLGDALDRYNIDLQLQDYVEGMWSKRAELWSDDPTEQKRIANRLGWLDSPEVMAKALPRLKRFAAAVRHDGIKHVVLLGMGGSSLAPEVMRAILGVQPGAPTFTMLDSTDPGSIKAITDRISLKETIFLIASKSGTTIEPNTLSAYFCQLLKNAGIANPARHLVAITDEGTALHEQAQHDHYREIFVNPSDIGGRYSALSFFGFVPAALMGIDLVDLLAWGRGMALLCGPTNAIAQNPGVALGIAMGAAARTGRDKLTLVTGPHLRPFGLWIEQLIAESTGKKGTGIVPIVGEPLGLPEVYGGDRLFVRLRLHGGDPEEHDRDGKMERLRAAGFPIITISMHAPAAIGAEFVRWEIATATAGAILDINPFDEPNVQQAKDATKALLRRFTTEGKLPVPTPQVPIHGTSLTCDQASWEKIKASGNDVSRPLSALAEFLRTVEKGDYLGLLAYLPVNDKIEASLQRVRSQLRDLCRVATMGGYGPRYLHSTGQLHKGGPNSGVFIVLTATPQEDLAIPGEPFSFATLELAQALGDVASLEATGRRVVHVHLDSPDPGHVERVCDLIAGAAAKQ